MRQNIIKNEISEKKRHIRQKLEFAATNETDKVFTELNTSWRGLSDDQTEENRESYGNNIIKKGKKISVLGRLISSFINPFTAILFILATVSLITDVIIADAGKKNFTTVIIITAMVFVSGALRFIQEARSDRAAEKLAKMVEITTSVLRNGEKMEIPLGEVVAGDVINLAAGDIIPADLRIIKSKDLFLSQASLTGESEPIEKISAVCAVKRGSLTETANLAFMGSTVISGSAVAVAVITGNNTMLGQVAASLSGKTDKTAFDKGVNTVSWLLIKFMLIMVPVVFFINGLTKGNWLDAFLFAISVAVGLTPEMLPMIVTSCLAKGAVIMSKKKTVIKNLNSIQNFGAMDVLCTDKTGTLTQDRVVLERHLNVLGEEDEKVLRHAYLNSRFQTGYKNLMDKAIIKRAEETGMKFFDTDGYIKVDEIPFDFSRRIMSVVVQNSQGKTQMITKGAVEEVLNICSTAEISGEIKPITEELKNAVMSTVNKLNDEGFRVLAVAQKTNPSPVGTFGVKDERDMVLIGYLAFLDPPKETTASAIKTLNAHGVSIKILTGDSDRVTVAVCGKVGIKIENLLLGGEVEAMSDETLLKEVEKTNVFAKLSPEQKARVVKALKKNGHAVGYLGDGINDASAMKAADVSISVDTAVDIAKESANVILLEKDLNVLENGIVEGRKVYANMIKYIKMTASSNFGNMLSVLAASAFLPFLPMRAIQLVLLNLIYDISCTAIPWDNVDKEYLMKPRNWNAGNLKRFMLWIGPVSSVFDIATYLFMFFVICPLFSGGAWNTAACNTVLFVSLFQTGWFVESMWSQTLVIHMIRTDKIPFIQSRASLPVILLTFSGITLLTLIPFSPIGLMLGFCKLPAVYFAYLTLVVTAYFALVTLIKKIYIKKYREFL